MGKYVQNAKEKRRYLMKKQTNILLLGIFFMILITGVSAQENSFIFKQSGDSDVRSSCFSNSSQVCGSGTDCFITIQAPNTSIVLNNQSMTNNYQYYNVTFNSTQKQELGQYSAVVFCTGDIEAYTTFNFLVTRTGKVADTSDSILYIGLLVFAFVIFSLSTWVMFRIPYKNPRNDSNYITRVTKTKYTKMLFFMISYGLFLWVFNLAITVSTNYLESGQFLGFVSFLFNILITGFWLTGFIILFWGFIELARDSKIRKELKKFGRVKSG